MKLLLPLAAALLAAAAPPPATADDLAWMAGDWVAENGATWTEERWSGPEGGMLIATSRTLRDGKVREFEFLRVAPGNDGALAYIAQPGGRPPVEFRLTARDATAATFENAAHDYPQRIHYARSGDTLTASISKLDGSQLLTWRFTRR